MRKQKYFSLNQIIDIICCINKFQSTQFLGYKINKIIIFWAYPKKNHAKTQRSSSTFQNPPKS